MEFLEGNKQESVLNIDLKHGVANQYVDILALNENKCQITEKEFGTYWADENKNYDEKCNASQPLFNAQTLEKYADFVINGHFLTDFLSSDTFEKIELKECPKCGKKFKLKGLRRHSFYCRKEGEVKACSKCGKKLSSNRSLKRHERNCNNSEYLYCNDCSYHTKRRYNLILHIGTIHSLDQHAVCPKCGKILKNKKSLTTHFHYCGKELNFHCNYCSYKTKYRRYLIAHSMKIHSKN